MSSTLTLTETETRKGCLEAPGASPGSLHSHSATPNVRILVQHSLFLTISNRVGLLIFRLVNWSSSRSQLKCWSHALSTNSDFFLVFFSLKWQPHLYTGTKFEFVCNLSITDNWRIQFHQYFWGSRTFTLTLGDTGRWFIDTNSETTFI